MRIVSKRLLINILNIMKIKFKTVVVTTLLLLMVIFASSCKKNEIKRVAVDTQFAVAIFSDTVSLREIIKDMDSTTQNWLRVRNDSIFAFYVDTIRGVLKASDLLSDIADVSFNSTTNFAMPPIASPISLDTVIDVDRFMTLPFHYDGYNIEEVLLREGALSFDFVVSPAIEHLKRLEIYSNQLINPEGDPLTIVIDYYNKGPQNVNLAGYRIIPEADTVAFGARTTLHIESGIYEGGEYTCTLTGGLTGVKFKTVLGTIDTPLDSIFHDQTAIDFGIQGITGSAVLPVPTIKVAYNNTFGFGAVADVTKLDFVNTNTGLVTNLLATDMVELTVHPTEGAWHNTRIIGLAEEIDALAGYNRLDFDGSIRMNLNDHQFSISDTSSVDIAADVEMPFSFKLSELCYTDTVPLNLAGSSNDSNVDDYIDQIDFYIDYNSKIKIDVDMQAIFMKNNTVLDSLFVDANSLNYSPTDEISTISVIITDRRLRNVLRSNQLVLRLGASTEAISPEPVMMMDSDGIFLRMRVVTKSSEIDIN